jgi:hypothetical protein
MLGESHAKELWKISLACNAAGRRRIYHTSVDIRDQLIYQLKT